MADAMVSVLLVFVGASLLLYVVLGGADYGAGILELLPAGARRERQKELINHAMGPVWEANHMWLIIVVVILFMGFPTAFNAIMTSLHLPVVALLIGIVVRGSAFTFRHYDAVQEPRSQAVYTALFGVSSLWTSFWLGVIAASLFRGRVDLDSRDFFEAYVAPWWGVFPTVMGIFTCLIFAFLASLYLVGEAREADLARYFARRAFLLNVLVILGGGAVFAASAAEGGDLLEKFLDSPGALACMVAATLFFGLLWSSTARKSLFLTRAVAASQCALILLGWYILQAPNVMLTKEGPMSFYGVAAPEATLFQLNLALIIGSLFIFPSLFYLLKVFKSSGGMKEG